MANAVEYSFSRSVPTRVVQIVAAAAREIPQARAAYVSPDGVEFVIYGLENTPEGYRLAARATMAIQREFWPTGERIVEGDYVPVVREPAPDWLVAYRCET